MKIRIARKIYLKHFDEGLVYRATTWNKAMRRYVQTMSFKAAYVRLEAMVNRIFQKAGK